ncbi:hypothetical protein [Pseudonocardia oroxyli]|uniref:Acetyltransferase (GNAT) domain-containing protein n=1 Tax=Pseudonocardia oroxyli TaxID=366584 RepID=A0A1G7ZC34_PSEOR|nr:hypothetical protein [Pseudonocardia oroxyli]SDH06185.1 hypothetical protein SAMN05216377_11892 [Pseudonocardia oroxyli]
MKVDSRAAKPTTDDPTPEDRVSAVFTDYVEAGEGPRWFLRRPRLAAGLIHDLARLPRHTVRPGGGPSGRSLRAALPADRPLSRALGHRAVLDLPATVAEYVDGHSKQTLRRKVRKARAQGITWKPVTRPEERRKLLAEAEDWERSLPAAHREADNSDLERHDLWLVALAQDGRPLLLAVIPYDDGWAVLRYFRSIGAGPEQSNARYLMMQVVAEELIDRGVRHLVDAVAPHRLPNGLRHFQRMLGFRIVRVRVA